MLPNLSLDHCSHEIMFNLIITSSHHHHEHDITHAYLLKLSLAIINDCGYLHLKIYMRC